MTDNCLGPREVIRINPQMNGTYFGDEIWYAHIAPAANVDNYNTLIWASTRQNLSFGFPTKRDSNQSTQLQRLARKLKLRLKQV